MIIKIIRKQNKNAERYGKYTFWVYQKNENGQTISQDYINSDIDIDKKALINFVNKNPYQNAVDFLWDNEKAFIYKQNNHNRVVVGFKKSFYLDEK